MVITSLFINQYIKLACKHSCWGSKYIPIWIAEVCLIIIFISIYERRGGGGTRSLYWASIMNIFSIVNLSIYLSVPLAGRSRYIDISMIYILSKLRYWFFVMTRLYVMIGVCHSGDWCPSLYYNSQCLSLCLSLCLSVCLFVRSL